MELFIICIVVLFFYAGFSVGRDVEKNKIYPGIYENLGTIPTGTPKTVIAIKSELGGVEAYIIEGKIPPKGFFRVTEEGVYVGIEKKEDKI